MLAGGAVWLPGLRGIGLGAGLQALEGKFFFLQFTFASLLLMQHAESGEHKEKLASNLTLKHFLDGIFVEKIPSLNTTSRLTARVSSGGGREGGREKELCFFP